MGVEESSSEAVCDSARGASCTAWGADSSTTELCLSETAASDAAEDNGSG